LTRLLEKKKKIVFVVDVPELGFDPKSCVDSRPLRITHRLKAPCAISRAKFDQEFREYREAVFAVLKEFPSVKVFDPSPVLCDEKYCWAMKDGKSLYQGSDHLSVDGSKLIAAKLAAAL